MSTKKNSSSYAANTGETIENLLEQHRIQSEKVEALKAERNNLLELLEQKNPDLKYLHSQKETIKKLKKESEENERIIWQKREKLRRLQCPSERPKTLPIHEWKPKFFGEDNKGLPLHDFLQQVELLAESENVSTAELHSKIHHLFEGRAKNWLMFARKKYTTWNVLKHELKQTFLPPDFDFLSRREYENRFQASDENFSIYLSEMNELFSKTSEPLTETQKLKILMRNMKPVYRCSLVSTDIESISELNSLCGRLDAIELIGRGNNSNCGEVLGRPKPSVR
jgi:Retrotransposon gag protein